MNTVQVDHGSVNLWGGSWSQVSEYHGGLSCFSDLGRPIARALVGGIAGDMPLRLVTVQMHRFVSRSFHHGSVNADLIVNT